MSIASTLYSTALTAGVNTTTFTRLSLGQYSGPGAIPKLLSLKAADPSKAGRSIALTLAYKPDVVDQFPTTKTGRVTVSFTCNGTLGTSVTAASMRELCKELASLLSQDSVVDGLLGGSYE